MFDETSGPHAENVLGTAALLVVSGLVAFQAGYLLSSITALGIAGYVFYVHLADGDGAVDASLASEADTERFVAVGLGLVALVSFESGSPGFGALALLLAIGLYWYAGPASAAESGESTSGASTSGTSPSETSTSGTCVACGAPIAAGADRCDDCGAVGSWRK